MADNQKIVNINGNTYVLNAFVGTKGFKLLAKLTKYAAPVIAEMTKLKETSEDEDVDATDIDFGAVLQNLFYEGTDEFVKLVFDLIEDAQKDGMTINIDKEFKQNYVAMMELAIEVIKLNFNDVFLKLGIHFD